MLTLNFKSELKCRQNLYLSILFSLISTKFSTRHKSLRLQNDWIKDYLLLKLAIWQKKPKLTGKAAVNWTNKMKMFSTRGDCRGNFQHYKTKRFTLLTVLPTPSRITPTITYTCCFIAASARFIASFTAILSKIVVLTFFKTKKNLEVHFNK